MLHKKYRLKKKQDFSILFDNGKFLRGSYVNVKIWKIDPAAYPKRNYMADDLKIGFIVSKKVSKKAVDRNRIKRKMREVVRLLIKDDKIHVGYFIALIAKPEALGADFKLITDDIHMLLHKAKVIRRL